MKKMVFIVSMLLASTVAVLAGADDICGVWSEDDGEGTTKITRQADGKYIAKINWVKVTTDSNGRPLLDKKNPVDSLRTHPIIGTVVMRDIVYNAKENNWTVGWCYDPRLGMTATGVLWFEDGKLWLKAKKYVFTKTKWFRKKQ